MFQLFLSPLATLFLLASLAGATPATDGDPLDDTDAGVMIIDGG